MEKETNNLAKTAYYYYRRRDIQKSLINFAKNREVIPFYIDRFGKRPDILQYESDIAALAERNLTSLHCSEELWSDPLSIGTELNEQQMNSLRTGWDLILDIDSPYIEYGKITAQLLIEALNFHNIHNIGIKFSGNKGFHIGVSWHAFPKKINELEIKNFFPQGPRFIAAYLKEIISKTLGERILELNTLKELSQTFKKKESELLKDNIFNPFSILELDTILISPRHLFRMPYSLHEKKGLASIVIQKEQIKSFHPGWAKPDRVFPKQFLPEPEQNEASELLRQALDWSSRHKKTIQQEQETGKYKGQEIIVKDLSPEFYSPCIKKILGGMKQDGRKRALFILLNYLKSINMEQDKIEKVVSEWNTKNYKKLHEGYIRTQIEWFKRQKKMLPPNCDKPLYKELALCSEEVRDPLCSKIKNPVNYSIKRLSFQQSTIKKRKGRKNI
ncbi:hypothetical protein HZA33_04825 [Candidatus Pacearchaeota archaeon]|nr:hypothetical protein [Candidatus Pacearchaeota archaeon]